MRLTRRALCLGALVLPGAALAQSLGIPQVPVVVLDRDRLYAGSAFGQRILRDIEAASRALQTENRRIESELSQEEQRLTDQRATMDTAEFRILAQDFDARVEAIRRAQEVKALAITQQAEQAQAVFFEVAGPVLQRLAVEAGALVILDRRSVIASADQIDITDLAIARINAQLGEGEGLVAIVDRNVAEGQAGAGDGQQPDDAPAPQPQD